MRAHAADRQDSGRAGAVPDYVAAARALQPLLDANAPRVEVERELPAEVLGAMHDARLFRMLLPRSLGGGELPPLLTSQVTEAIAWADASAAWCLGQSTGCAMSSAFMQPDAARHVFGPANAVLAWGAGPQGKAVAEAGGYRASGKWYFASGSRHATWLGGHCKVFEADGTPRLRKSGKQVERTMLIPRAEAKIDDNWFVMGLKGTGSDGYSIEERFFPDELTLDRDAAEERVEAASIYKIPTTAVYAAAFSGVALGNARGMLDQLKALGLGKTQRGARSSMRDSPVFQSDLAQIEAQHSAARAYLHQVLEQAWAKVPDDGFLGLEERIAIRLATTYAINQAVQVAAACFRAAGSDAIFENKGFERRLRDAYTVSQQAQGRATHFETVGRHMMGLEVDTMFL